MRDMTMRQGMWPPSRRVVSRGLSRRTCQAVTYASLRSLPIVTAVQSDACT